ncbi:MAG: hypothetical protein WD377_06475 [Nitriliruptoraceae bacterium]
MTADEMVRDLDDRIRSIPAVVREWGAANRNMPSIMSGVQETAGAAKQQVADARDDVRAQIAEWEEPARRAGVGALRAAQAALSVFVALPALIVRALGIAREVIDRVDDVAARSHAAAERTREIVHRIEPSERERRRRKLTNLGWVAVGFGAGLTAGIAVERWRAAADSGDDGQTLEQHSEQVSRRDEVTADGRHLTVAEPSASVSERD